MFFQLIKSKGLTCSELARQSDVSKTTISELCNNKRVELKLTTAKKIADTLGITLEELCNSLGVDENGIKKGN